jgi:hypothetical protein
LVPEAAAFADFRLAPEEETEEKEPAVARAVESAKPDYWSAEREFGMGAAARMPRTLTVKQCRQRQNNVDDQSEPSPETIIAVPKKRGQAPPPVDRV